MKGPETDLLHRFQEHLRTIPEYHPHQRCLVACSGGVDSVVLLHLLKSSHKGVVGVLHINHNLRMAAMEDARFVQAFARKLGLQCELRSVDVRTQAQQARLSLEEAGHRMRASIIQEYLTEHDWEVVALGHHHDDQLESVLLNLYHGSGIQGLSGMSAWHAGKMRPLLPFDRRILEEYARSHNLSWRHDQSNHDLRYRRNRLRHALLPFLRAAHRPLFNELSALVNSAHKLNKLTDETAYLFESEHVKQINKSKLQFDLPQGAGYFAPVLKRLFDSALSTFSSCQQGLSTRHFEVLCELLEGPMGKQQQLPMGIIAAREPEILLLYEPIAYLWSAMDLASVNGLIDTLFFTLEHHPPGEDPAVKTSFNPAVCYLRTLSDTCLRPIREGDKIHPIASSSEQRVMKILSDSKVPKSLRAYYPVLEQQGQVVWVPGICADRIIRIEKERTDIVDDYHRLKITWKENIGPCVQ